MGWAKPGPGRPIGSRARSQLDAEREYFARDGRRAVSRLERSPLAIMLARMEGDTKITEEQFQAAVAAAPFVHPRLAATEATIRSDNVHRVLSDEPLTPEQWLERYGPSAAANLANVDALALEAADPDAEDNKAG